MDLRKKTFVPKLRRLWTEGTVSERQRRRNRSRVLIQKEMCGKEKELQQHHPLKFVPLLMVAFHMAMKTIRERYPRSHEILLELSHFGQN